MSSEKPGEFEIDPMAYAWVRDMYAKEWSLWECEVQLTKLIQQVRGEGCGQKIEDLEVRARELEVLVKLVRKRCREAVPEWAPELREALARIDALEKKR